MWYKSDNVKCTIFYQKLQYSWVYISKHVVDYIFMSIGKIVLCRPTSNKDRRSHVMSRFFLHTDET